MFWVLTRLPHAYPNVALTTVIGLAPTPVIGVASRTNMVSLPSYIGLVFWTDFSLYWTRVQAHAGPATSRTRILLITGRAGEPRRPRMSWTFADGFNFTSSIFQFPAEI